MITSENIKNFPDLSKSGLTPRKTRNGPEYDFLQKYLQGYLPSTPKGQELTVFIEPNVDSVFPDAVAVYWDLNTAEKWNEQRMLLSKQDIRLLHYFSLVNTTTYSNLEIAFSCNLHKSLKRLEEAQLIKKNKLDYWSIKPLKNIFAVKRLITIEAKISDWQGGLLQAFFHTWFASESYLLISKLPKGKQLVDDASRLGIGIATDKVALENSLAKARCENIPKSYASWLFNEWAWKAKKLTY